MSNQVSQDIWFELPEWEEEIKIVRIRKRRYKPVRFHISANGQLFLPAHKEPKRLPPHIPSIDEIIPDFLREKLRPFQLAGVLYGIEKKRLFIADDMGLGKTLQALSIIESLKLYPAIVVCPASLKYNWQNEVKKWIPHRTTRILSGSPLNSIAGLAGRYAQDRTADIIIINYDVIKNFEKVLIDYKPKAFKGIS